MIKWKIGTENDDGEEVYLQIWQSSGVISLSSLGYRAFPSVDLLQL